MSNPLKFQAGLETLSFCGEMLGTLKTASASSKHAVCRRHRRQNPQSLFLVGADYSLAVKAGAGRCDFVRPAGSKTLSQGPQCISKHFRTLPSALSSCSLQAACLSAQNQLPPFESHDTFDKACHWASADSLDTKCSEPMVPTASYRAARRAPQQQRTQQTMTATVCGQQQQYVVCACCLGSIFG